MFSRLASVSASAAAASTSRASTWTTFARITSAGVGSALLVHLALTHADAWPRVTHTHPESAQVQVSTSSTGAGTGTGTLTPSLEDRVRQLYPERASASPSTAKQEHGLWGSRNLSDAIGRTPLIALKSLEKATGCTIWAKAEHMNPGYSVKDRAAKYMIDEAERTGKLTRGQGVVIEATGGNTGIGVALLCAARAYQCMLCMPSNISPEKIDMMRKLGAQVKLAPLVPFGHPDHYYSVASRLAVETPNSIFTNQFENVSNARGHYETTGPEIWAQTRGRVDGVCVSAGTGGTIAGLSLYLKGMNPSCVSGLIDPPGSGLHAWLTTGTFQAAPGSTIMEGIGIMRLTANMKLAIVDRAYRGHDQEAVDMANYLLAHEGLWVGPSAALNVVGAVKMARELGPGSHIVTVLCDSGDKYKNTLYDGSYLESRGLHVRARDDTLTWIS